MTQSTHITFKNARVIDPKNGTDTIGELSINDGVIVENPSTDLTIDCDGLCLAPGIVDFGVKVCEPGERHKESYKSAGLAAAAGGVTSMIIRPDTEPAIDSPETLEFALRRAQEVCAVRTYPMATLTKGRRGKEMAELAFLRDVGAVAFTDCDAVSTEHKALTRAFAYAADLGALVVGHPQDANLSAGASATSSKFATLRAIPAVSDMAEAMGVNRDFALAEMTGVAYHADQITTERSLEILREAKNRGLNVSAGVSIHHASLNELDVGDYRTFFKVKPPLRSEEDRLAVVAALADGTLDVLCSMHTPQDEESKRLPFEEAASGAVALETLLPAALRLVHSGHMDLPTLWRAISLNPAQRFGLAGGSLAIGQPADLVLFDPDVPFVMDREKLVSKCRNTPFDGQRMQGRVLKTFVAGKEVFSQ